MKCSGHDVLLNGSELVIPQGFYLVDVGDDRIVCVKLLFNLSGDLVGKLAGAREHLDFHVRERVRNARLPRGAHVAAAFAAGGVDDVSDAWVPAQAKSRCA